MPNWCECYLEINSDNNENLIIFFNDNKENDETVLSFNISVPIPENEEDNWYSWRCENWGTKWDLNEETNYTLVDNNLKYLFNTAWGPPTNWLITTSKLYPTLEFNLVYGEPGMNFGGSTKIVNGEFIKIEEYSYSEYNWNMNKEYVIDMLDSNLISNTIEIDENTQNKMNIQKNIIQKICDNNIIFLPDDIQNMIVNNFQKNIRIREIHDYIDKNIDLLVELCNDEVGIYDEEFVKSEIVQEFKKHYL